MRLPSLKALLAFEASARLGSFTSAAAELSVTQGAVSQQIKSLEVHLGQRLFYRHKRGEQLGDQRITLTPAGEQLATALHPPFLQIKQAVDELACPDTA